MTTPRTLADLDRIHADAAALIRRRAALAGAKALMIGRESLSDLTDDIAALYGLSPADRAMLAKAGAGTDRADAPAAEPAVASAGLAGALRLAKQAQKATGYLGTARKVATGAGVALRGGRLLSRAVPLAAAAWGAYAVGTGGWFLYRANRYNAAARDLLAARIGREVSASR